MRRISYVLVATILAACARTEQAATDTSAMVPPTPQPISLAEVAGTWNFRVMPEGSDTVVTTYTMTATGDTAGWVINIPNRPPIPVRVVAVAGDSIVAVAGPFESVLRRGVQVRTTSVVRLQDGRLVGPVVARYATKSADSVARLRSEGTRAP